MRNGVRVRIIGERDRSRSGYPPPARRGGGADARQHGLTLVVAFNYGARQEIARAARRIAAAMSRPARLKPEAITDGHDRRRISTRRISRSRSHHPHRGEQRLSNFLLWQAAYSELVFVPVYWPDFDRAALEAAIAEYRRRERRFGGLAAQTGS